MESIYVHSRGVDTIKKKMLTTVVCLAALSTNTAWAEVDKAAQDIPEIQPGQAFYINEKGNVIVGELPIHDNMNVVRVDSASEFMEEQSEAITEVEKYESTTEIAEEAQPIKEVITETAAQPSTEEIVIDGVANPKVVDEKNNLSEIVVNQSVEEISIETLTITQEPTVPEQIKMAKTKGETVRDAACEQMTKLLNRSISSDGVRLMVEMLNRNKELSNIDKLNCLIGYWRAIDNSDIPRDSKVELSNLVNDIYGI